jgi:beta-galactosidase GanA
MQNLASLLIIIFLFFDWPCHRFIMKTMKKTCLLPCIFLFCQSLDLGGQPGKDAGHTIPRLVQQGTATQLVVDGNPYLIVGGELGNSTASDLSAMKHVWPVLSSLHLNTLLVPVYWETMEPEEGKFDFGPVDSIITQAAQHSIRLVLLWFGSWKNSMSCYVPLWIKKDFTRFPRARDNNDRALEMLSAFSEENVLADLHAFTALMKHLHETDLNHNVIMVQVENETGMLPVASDFSKPANDAFLKPVPMELIRYLQRNKENLDPAIKNQWARSGYKASGTWEDIFGVNPATEEIFMAWHFALYTNRVAEAGKAEYPLPMYVNAALNRPSLLPGEYPSGGPLPHLMDIWKAGAPSVDFLSPDIYFPDVADWCIQYRKPDNPLFIPEIMRGLNNAAQVFYAFGKHDAIGFSPFAIESVTGKEAERLAAAYACIGQLSPLILEHQGKGTMTGVILDRNNSSQVETLGDYTLHISYEPLDRYACKGNLADSTFCTGGIIIATGPDEYIVAGSGLIVTFSPAFSGRQMAGIGSIDEGRFENGKWIIGMRLNGDQSHQGRHMRLPNDRFSIQRVRLYRYE